jgi:hypothetical protein
MNQPFATLYDMLKAQNNLQQTQTNLQLSNDQLLQLEQCLAALPTCARDQTPIFKSAMLGFSHPLTDKLQVSADATVVNLTQPISPFSDPSLGTLPAGNEYFYSTQLIANNIIKDGDMYIAALRYSQTGTSNLYVLDLNTRYPLTPDLRLSPRLRLGYTEGTGVDLKQYTVLPSFLVDYYWTKALSLEVEVGALWTSSVQSGIKSKDTELLATIGLRYDFYSDTSTKAADDKNKLLTPAAAALCRYNARPDSGSCAPPSVGSR